MPAARVYVPGQVPHVPQSPGCGRGSVSTCTRNMVVPYMTMASPGSRTPTLVASAHASMVPVVIGSPTGSPVAAAASRVTCPTTSVGQANSGSSSPGATDSAQSVAHSRRRRSYIGTHWLAD